MRNFLISCGNDGVDVISRYSFDEKRILRIRINKWCVTVLQTEGNVSNVSLSMFSNDDFRLTITLVTVGIRDF